MFLLWHPWLTTTNLSYSFPLLETSATASCGTTGKSWTVGSTHRFGCPFHQISASANVFKILVVLVVDFHMVCTRGCWETSVSSPMNLEVLHLTAWQNFWSDPRHKTLLVKQQWNGAWDWDTEKRVTKKWHDSREISTLWKMLEFFSRFRLAWGLDIAHSTCCTAQVVLLNYSYRLFCFGSSKAH